MAEPVDDCEELCEDDPCDENQNECDDCASDSECNDDEGPPGPIGPQGFRGPQGINGTQGNVGFTGPQGDEGKTGFQGPQGINGFQGDEGKIGTPGPQGINGFQGDEGKIGTPGPQGPQGNFGFQGDIGTTVSGLAAVAEYYGIAGTVDFPAPIPLNMPVPFAHTVVETGGITQSPPFVASAANPSALLQDTFLLPTAGIYKISYLGEFTEPGQLAIHYQAGGVGAFARLPQSGKGRSGGETLLGGYSLVVALASSRIQIVNSISIGALTPTLPASSGTGDLSVNLIIERLSDSPP